MTQAPYDAVAMHGRLLCELSDPVPRLPPETPLQEVERRFRDDPGLRAVAVSDPAGPALLTRVRLETLLSGRLGYGRALLARARVGTVVQHDGFHLESGQSLREAAAALLGHGAREDDVLVLDPDGGTAAAPVAVILREVGMMFREIALRDPLTGLANRRMLDERGGELLAAGADATRLAVLYVDLDGFKQVNDALGHKAGDAALIAFAQRLVRTVRPTDLAGRLGGDEFAVLLGDVDEEQATAVADQIVTAARRPFGADQQLYLSASVGIATGLDLAGRLPTDSAEGMLDALLQHADGAMLHAKRAGKARTSRLRRREESGAFERRALIRSRLHEALLGDGLQLHYQPKLSLHSGRVESVEALLRWTDEQLGRVSPLELIAVAEHTGQISALGEWVLRTACAQARRWHDEGRDWAVAINVSPVQLAAPGLAGLVRDALERAGVPARLLQVEVTESSAVSDMGLAAQQLAELQACGVRVHLDDFGTGYSSLAMLRRLPVSTLKIDQSIIGRVDSDEADAQLLAGVINAAHTLGMTVVAEGVERHSQIDRLPAPARV